MDAPLNPAGALVLESDYGSERRNDFIAVIEAAPARLRSAVAGLSGAQLDTRYRNWTIRQIVHHLADSHVNSYVRFKWALTEDTPTIKAYDEGRWAALGDSRVGDVDAPLALLDGLHRRWVQLLRSLSEEQFRRAFIHPESQKTVPLSEALCYYAWHCRHHVGQVLWLCERHGWRADAI
jgi:uncharacterized damage-inducible protein DinB